MHICKKNRSKVIFSAFFHFSILSNLYLQSIPPDNHLGLLHPHRVSLATVMTADSARFGILNGDNSRENYRSHARMLKSKVRIGFKITTKRKLLKYHPNTRLWLPNRKPHTSRYSKMHLWRLICHNESLWFKHIERCICHVVLSYQFLLLLSDKSYNPLKSTQDVSKYDIYSRFLYHILSLCA
jgi:hypothetical protein